MVVQLYLYTFGAIFNHFFKSIIMDCIIIDDEAMSRAIIVQMIKEHSNYNIKEEFNSAIDAIKYLNQNEVDLIFLDIHMPNFSGIDFIQTIKNQTKVILITADKNYAIEAFEYENVVDYLVKPLVKERFIKAIEKSDRRLSVPFFKKPTPDELSNELYININRKLIKIQFDKISLIESKGDYIYIKTDTKSYTVHSTLKKIIDKLPKDIFMKVHRCFIINTNQIVDIEDNTILLGKDIIPLSRTNRKELMLRLNLL